MRSEFFLRHVLRDTRLPAGGLVCAACVDGFRPRGPCGTHPDLFAFVFFFGALLLCGFGVVGALRCARRRRLPEALVAGATNVYSCALSLYLCLPYVPHLHWPFA